MAVKFNKDLFLWSLGVLQPASAVETMAFISNIYPNIPSSSLPSIKDVEYNLKQWTKDGVVMLVRESAPYLYSLTYKGSMRLSVKIRRNRDKTRLFLLKKARSYILRISGEEVQELAGVSPAEDDSSILQDARPIPLTVARAGQRYWPRVSKQLKLTAGPDITSPDIYFTLCSFPSVKTLRSASLKTTEDNDLSIYDIAIAIGISPRLLTSFIHATHKHYRSFQIGKRGGGTRIINSPRVFIKVVQYWVLDYLLHSLKIHPSCQSYQKGKSILSNASSHVGKQYVANMDIVDFFGSIKTENVNHLLKENSFGDQLSMFIARLVTYNNALPQGAPTSPIISNSYLFKFDQVASKISNELELAYTRYADDITVSGNFLSDIKKCINKLTLLLNTYGLQLNDKKTRIATKGGQQRVTGLVVNVQAAPPRLFRRKIRAMFHNADINPEQYNSRIAELNGYLSYLQSFPHIKDKEEIARYKKITKKLLES